MFGTQAVLHLPGVRQPIKDPQLEVRLCGQSNPADGPQALLGILLFGADPHIGFESGGHPREQLLGFHARHDGISDFGIGFPRDRVRLKEFLPLTSSRVFMNDFCRHSSLLPAPHGFLVHGHEFEEDLLVFCRVIRSGHEKAEYGSANQDERFAAPPLSKTCQRLTVIGLALLVALHGQLCDGELCFYEAFGICQRGIAHASSS